MANIVNKDRVPYRLWNPVNKVWDLVHVLTKANSVDANDGKTLETKVGAINGITSDVNCEDETVAASAAMVNQLNSNLTFPSGNGFYPDEKDGVKGYNTSPERGADTFFPFKKGYEDTPGTATEADILEGKSCWVNGRLLNGILISSDVYKRLIIDSLQSANSGLTYNNTFDDVANFLQEYFAQPISKTISDSGYFINNRIVANIVLDKARSLVAIAGLNFSFYQRNSSASADLTFYIEGSSNGSSYSTVFSRKGTRPAYGGATLFSNYSTDISSPAYKYWRVRLYDTGDDNFSCSGTLKFK